MKICLLANALSIHTDRWLNYLLNKGYQVYLISFRRKEIKKVPTYFYEPPYNNFLYKIFYFLKNVKELKKLIWEIKPDILHAHYLTSYGFIGVLSGYKPLIVSAWGSDLLVDSKKSFFHRQIIKKTLKEADMVTVMAGHMIPMVKKLGGSTNKTVKVSLGIDLERFNIKGIEGRNNRKIVIISCRTFERVHNIEYFVSSLPYVVSSRKDVEIRFYGDGTYRRHCQSLTKKLGVEYYTRFFGFVPYDQMPSWYKQADIYVSSSVSDGDHVSLLEALACGSFPVVSDISANREWIVDGKNGFLVPLGDPKLFAQKILTAIEDEHLREKATEYNFELIKSKAKFGIDLEIMEEYYKTLCTRRSIS